jgi:shikimate dehydrogenase
MTHTISGKSRLLGVLGDPVSHSLSPRMHNAAIQSLDLPFVYVPLPCASQDLGPVIQGLKALGFGGANVTIPHKESVMQFVDRLDPLAVRTGSVNTLYWHQGELVGTTTDGRGAMRHLQSEGVDLQGKHVAVLGYGGSAKSIAFALVEIPDLQLTLVGRNAQKASVLLDGLLEVAPGRVHFCTFEEYPGIQKQVDILVQTTPLGMTPHTDASALPPECFEAGQIVYDIVYNPAETLLMRYAKAAGCQVISGLGMLLHQGALAFELWTGCEAPLAEMSEALKGATP